MIVENLNTEQRNKNTLLIDQVSTLEQVTLINNEDQTVAKLIADKREELAEIIDYIWENFEEGRLFYCGAGTSGRLAVVDASECPPTFGSDPSKVVGLIAGGTAAFTTAIEGAEDDETLCQKYLEEQHFSSKDILVGIAASGRTPFVTGGLRYARSIGAKTVGISNSKDSLLSEIAEKSLEVITGPEVVTGSTRMKAGTSQKLILNTISTVLMIKMGKVYSNLMVDVQPKNEKLIERAHKIVAQSLEVDEARAQELFESANHSVKHAIVMGLLNLNVTEADNLLEQNKDRIADIITSAKKEKADEQ